MRWPYAFDQWLLTLLLGPFITGLTYFLSPQKSDLMLGLLEVYPPVIIASALLSFPAFLAYLLFFHILTKLNMQMLVSKIILTGITVILIALTSEYVIGLTWNFVLGYSISTAITGLILNLKKINKSDLNNMAAHDQIKR